MVFAAVEQDRNLTSISSIYLNLRFVMDGTIDATSLPTYFLNIEHIWDCLLNFLRNFISQKVQLWHVEHAGIWGSEVN